MKKRPTVDKKTNLLIVSIILTIIVVISIGTYALIVWSSEENTQGTIIVSGVPIIDGGIEFIAGPSINAKNIGPIFDYTTDGEETYIVVKNHPSGNIPVETISLNAYLHIGCDDPNTTEVESCDDPNTTEVEEEIGISENLKNSDFKFAILSTPHDLSTSPDDGTYEYTLVNEGNFLDAVDGETFSLFNNVNIQSNTTISYRIIFYIDGNVKNDLSLQDNVLNGYINILQGDTGVEYYANGGTGAPVAQIVSQGSSMEEGTSQSLVLSTITPTRDNYDFVNWNTQPDGTGTEYNPGDTINITNDTGYIKLYAIWTPKRYNINYFVGNGTSTAGATKIGTSDCAYGEQCPLSTFLSLNGVFPNSSGTAQNYYWSFAGWSSTETGTSVAYEDGETFTFSETNDINIYAVGIKTFNFYSGREPTSLHYSAAQYWNPYSTSSSYLTSITLPNQINISGWEFIGYRSGSDTTASASVTFSASQVGEEVTPAYSDLPSTKSIYRRTLTISFNANGGTGTIAALTPYQYYNSGYGSNDTNIGSNVSIPSDTLPSSGFTKPGYSLAGWLDETTNTTYNLGATYTGFSPEASNTSITKNLKAVWTPRQYAINYYLGNGSNSSTLIGTSYCTYGTNCTLDPFDSFDTSFTSSSNGWSFYKWGTSSTSLTTSYNDLASFIYNTTEDINLYAIGKKDYNFYYGIAPSTVNSSIKVTQYWNPQSTSSSYLSSIIIPTEASSNIANYGWTLVGYEDSNNATTSLLYNSSTIGTEQTPAYNAEQNLRGVYQRDVTVAFDANGGSGTTDSATASQYYNTGYSSGTSNTGAAITTPSFTLPPSTFTAPSGLSFDTWNQYSDGTGTSYTVGSSYSAFTPAVDSTNTSVTLYATWKDGTEPTGTVTIVKEGGEPSQAELWEECYNLCIDDGGTTRACTNECDNEYDSSDYTSIPNYVTTANVTLQLSASSDTTQMCISNTTSCSSSNYETYATTKSWTLSTGDGTKTVYVWFKDAEGNVSSSYTATDSILLDSTGPTVTLSVSTTNNDFSSTYYQSVTVSASSSDAGTGVGITKYCRTNSTSCVPDSTGTSASITTSGYRICFAAVDIAGNTGETKCSSIYNIGTALYDYLIDNNVSGLHETKIGTDTLYRFSGTTGNTGIYNYLCFGGTSCTSGSSNMYRIIGVEPTTGYIKVIKQTSYQSGYWYTSGAASSSSSWGWPNSRPYTAVNGGTGNWLTDSGLSNYIVSHSWNYGMVDYSYVASSSNTRARVLTYEDNASVTASVGIVSLGDFLLAYRGDINYWSDPGLSTNWIALINNGCSSSCQEWFMNLQEYINAAEVTVWRANHNSGLGVQYSDVDRFKYRPTFYINKETIYKSGTGTSSNPFIVY